MLTGVRGVGKTTTARLIARALNYDLRRRCTSPSMNLKPLGPSIATPSCALRHVDVMEMDAASRTGVADIREILDGARYAPGLARYKVYIIDEVHMLSTSAFNALLKTLEEPPEHVKFIFATTEIRKVPVTVLSRCQRFDLKRVDREVLTDHLARICDKENTSVDRDGLAAIARAAEGSVRDALSLLDQAIVQADRGETVTSQQIRDMLGLADRSRVLDLLEAALENRAKDALDELRHQYDSGADPQVLMRDLLDHLHAVSRIKAAGKDADLGEAQETVDRLAKLAEAHSLASLGRLWKTTLTGLDDVRNAPDPVSAAEMAVIRLMAAASLPSPEDAARLLAGIAPSGGGANPKTGPGGEAPSGPNAAHAPEPEPEPVGPKDLDAMMEMIDAARDIGLKLDVERCFRPVSMKPGAIVFEPTENAPSNLGGRIAAFLQEQTGERWLVDSKPNTKGGETIAERRARQHEERMDAIRRDPAMIKALTLFPGAEIITVDEAPALPTSDDDDQDTARQENSR
jgi:DNA polymerase-3 subunit gamma/tau